MVFECCCVHDEYGWFRVHHCIVMSRGVGVYTGYYDTCAQLCLLDTEEFWTLGVDGDVLLEYVSLACVSLEGLCVDDFIGSALDEELDIRFMVTSLLDLLDVDGVLNHPALSD